MPATNMPSADVAKLFEKPRMVRPSATTTAPAAIMVCGGCRSTQMAAATTANPPMPSAATSQPKDPAERASRAAAANATRLPVSTSFRSAAAVTSTRPSFRSEWRSGNPIIAAPCVHLYRGLGSYPAPRPCPQGPCRWSARPGTGARGRPAARRPTPSADGCIIITGASTNLRRQVHLLTSFGYLRTRIGQPCWLVQFSCSS